MFARLKHPDEDLPFGWSKDANFSVFNLSAMLTGANPERVFGKSDLKSLKVIDRDEAEHQLSKIKPKKAEQPTITVINRRDDEESPKFIKARER